MDKVAAAQEEHDRLMQEQIEIDDQKIQLEERKIAVMRETSRLVSTISALKDRRKGNSARINQLRTFLDFAETIG